MLPPFAFRWEEAPRGALPFVPFAEITTEEISRAFLTPLATDGAAAGYVRKAKFARRGSPYRVPSQEELRRPAGRRFWLVVYFDFSMKDSWPGQAADALITAGALRGSDSARARVVRAFMPAQAESAGLARTDAY